MAKLSVLGGTTSLRTVLFVQDSASTTGAGKTGLLFNSAGLTAYYVRPGSASVAITLATQTVTGAFSSGGFVEIDSTNLPGFYRFDVPDAAIASGIKCSAILFKGATGMVPLPLEFEITATDNQDSVRGGMTALPNAVPGAAGGVFIAGTNAATTANITGTITTVTNLTNAPTSGDLTATMKASVTTAATAATPTVTAGTVTDKTGYALSSAGVQAIWDALTSALTTVGSIGKRLADNIDAAISSRSTYAGGAVASVTGAVGSVTGNVGGNVTGSVGSVLGAVGSVTGNVGGNVVGSVASVAGAVGSVTAGVTVTTNNDKTGYGLSSAAVQAIWDAATSALTTVGSIGKWILDKLDVAVSTRSTYAGGDTSGVMTLLSRIPGTVAAQSGDSYARLGAPAGASVSADIAAIQADTDDIQTRIPAALVSGRMDSSVGEMATDTITSAAVAASAVSEIQTGLATSSALTSVAGDVTAVKAKTDNLPAAPASVGDIPTAIQNADALLDRNMATGTDSGSSSVRTVRQALRTGRNKVTISAGTITVFKEDDATTSWTGTVGTDGAALPIVSVDPA